MRTITISILSALALLWQAVVFGGPTDFSGKPKKPAPSASQAQQGTERHFPFTIKSSLDEWEKKIFKGHVEYTVEEGKDLGQVRGVSDSAASSMFYKIKFKAKDYPMISWKWQVIKFPPKKTTDIKNTAFEDYAARIIVIFPANFFPKSKAVEYIWENDLPVGTVYSSPYTANVKIIVLRSADKDKGKWFSEERNIFEDYKMAFGEEPKLSVGAIAFMTNSDNSQDKAEALYTDIKVGYKK